MLRLRSPGWTSASPPAPCRTVGVGALIAQATAGGDYSLLLAATLALITTVVVINRLFWRRLYKIAEERYRME
jgi:NitT/TauT family transport system permease protein